MVPPPSVVIHLLAFFSASLHSDLGLDLSLLSQGLLTVQGGSSSRNAKCARGGVRSKGKLGET